ncbi:SH3 domain-containing protein [Microcoleus sp. A2-C5]|uniref:SH3 domain-containing protein n=1 Tax=Microcoleaceae TaxID=1892252 RepID=UPI0022376140|nr:SH3 domain-containing protein [Lyngbya sp. CCAP 1446/10]MCW6051593.1 SH3 domain-containing protein [Lyngbya sp. CCAP 1446/10]
MNSVYSVFKFLVGFLLAIVLMAGASVAAALYFAAKLSTTPERPIFSNDKTAVQIAGTGAKSTGQASPVSTSDDAASSDAPSPKPLEPGAYRALVTQPIGLILRDSGNRDSNRIGGVGYKEKVVVLEDSPDKEWQRIRVEDGNREGWVKGGNTEKVEGE